MKARRKIISQSIPFPFLFLFISTYANEEKSEGFFFGREVQNPINLD